MTPEEQEQSQTTNQSAAERTEDQEQRCIPLLAEEVSVSKKQIVTRQVKISAVTQQHEQLVEELLENDNVEIERTAVGRQVDQAPTVREDGDSLIIPIVEEVVVVERRLVSKRIPSNGCSDAPKTQPPPPALLTVRRIRSSTDVVAT